MATMNPVIASTYTGTSSSPSLLTRFFVWSRNQEPNRFLWTGIILAAHGCILTPITLLFIMLGGASLTLCILALIAMGMALVTNLAAMPTRYTIPIFVLSLLIDVALIVAASTMGLDIAKTYI